MSTMTSMSLKTTIAGTYKTTCTYGALATVAPSGGSAGTEVSGGTYARISMAATWGTPSAGAVSSSALAFNVPGSTTVVAFELYDALTAGNFLDGASITSQLFSSPGTYTITPTFTQS